MIYDFAFKTDSTLYWWSARNDLNVKQGVAASKTSDTGHTTIV